MISICIPFHLRGNTTHPAYIPTFRHYAALPYHVNLCGSEGALSRKFCDQFLNDTTHYVEVPQGPVCMLSKGDNVLREKFNDSLATLPKSDWYCLAGADDIVPATFFEWLADQDASGITMAGQSMDSMMYPVDMNHYPHSSSIQKITLNYSVALKLTGGVNAFSAEAMRFSSGKPYQRDGCETGAELFFAEHGEIIRTTGYVVMPKVDSALNKFSKLVGRHKRHLVGRNDINLVRSYLK